MAGIPETEQGRESIPLPAPLDRLSEGARRVLVRADAEASRFNHKYIGTEHLLLGLVSGDPGDQAVTVLANLGIDHNTTSSAVEFVIGRGEGPVVGKIGITPRAVKVIQFAAEEARMDDSGEITSLHLLRGLVREGEGTAAGVLESLGVNLDRILQQARPVQAQLEQEARRAEEAEETLTPEQESVNKLKMVLENPHISRRTKTFIMGLVDKMTEFAAQEDTSEPKAD